MALAAYTALIKISTNTVLDITAFDLPLKIDMVESTAFGGSGGAAVGTKTYVPSLFGAVLKCSGNWNKADTTGQAALETAFFARSATTLVFTMPNGTNTYTASCFVSGYDPKGDVHGIATVDFELTVNGACTPA